MNIIGHIFGNFTFKYVPTHEMFLLFSVIIPAIFLLYTLGHTIFVIGEFKEKNKNIPKLLILTMAKVFLIGIIFYNIMNIIIQNDFNQNTNFLINSILFCYGLFIIIETLVVNLQLNKTTNFDKNQKINDETLKIKFRDINKKNIILFGFGAILKIIILILSIIELFNSINVFSTLLTICFVFYVYMKIEFLKYIKSINK